jgi:O-antigen ligase
MHVKKNLFFNFIEILIIIFPAVLLFRSFTINFYLILISFIVIYLITKKKISFPDNFKWYLFFIIFIIFNSFFAENIAVSLRSSFSQLRFVLFAILVYNFSSFELFYKARFFYLFLLFFVVFDTYFQFFSGKDIFGFAYDQEYFRLSGPFADEYIVGFYIAFLSVFTLSIFKNLSNTHYRKILYYLFSIFLIFTVLFTGERTSFLIIFFSFLILNMVNFNLKKVLFFLLPVLVIFFFLFQTNDLFKSRYNEMYKFILNIEKSSYGRIYSSSLELWKKNKITGVGLKNYRHECKKLIDPDPKNIFPYCSSHPHNYVIELLVETGVIGLFLFLSFIFSIFKVVFISKIYDPLITKNYLSLGSLILFLSFVWPLKTSGSIISTFNASIFWFVLGVLLSFVNFKKRSK